MTILPPIVGETAPAMLFRTQLGEKLTLESVAGQPVVLAFASGLCPDARELSAARAELRGLGAVLVIVSKDGVWLFRPDDEIELRASRDELEEGALALLRAAYGLEPETARDSFGLFILDGQGRLRSRHVVVDRVADVPQTLTAALSSASSSLLSGPSRSALLSRREVVVTSLVGAFALTLADACRAPAQAPPSVAPLENASPYEMDIVLRVNGASRPVRIDARTTLLDALRERLALTGSKKGCDHGQCGACTVLVDGRRVNACLTLAVMVEKSEITTIEGLARGETLHPLQAAFAEDDALQCGYCTPGQIMSAMGLVREGHAHSDDEVREQMSGNICRCGAYCNIVSAVQKGRKGVS